MMDITAATADFVDRLKFEDLPAPAVATAKVAVRDCLGVALAGSQDESALICAAITRSEQGSGESTVIGHDFRAPAQQAAWVNGTAAHALDFDHSFSLMGQPTAPIVPAIFSLGESLGVSGKRLVEAYVAGFEVTGKLAFALRNASEGGWHGPLIIGGFGAAAACAKLLDLTKLQIEMALGIMCSMSGGVVANFGTMTKPLHVGLAARNGVLAALLARDGFTANSKGLEGKVGFFEMFYPQTQLRLDAIDELGKSWAIVTDGIKIKPYACGGLTHVAIDGVLAICREHRLEPEMIESIQADVIKHIAERIVFRVPQTGVQGKFCMNYLLARAAIDGKIGIDVFTDEAVRDERILKLAERVEMRHDPSLKTDDPGGRPCRVTVKLKNGQTFFHYAEHAKGSRETPLSEDELRNKFRECAAFAIPADRAEEALRSIDDFDRLESMQSFCRLFGV